jgi:outer membrane immunogenic protein
LKQALILRLLIAFTCLAPLAAAPVHADGGWYLGASAGLAFLELDIEDGDDNVFPIDEDDSAWKVFGGYVLDLPLIDLGVEAGYVDLGSPVARFPGPVGARVDGEGLNIWGTAGVSLGPVGVYGKLGAIAWDLDARTIGAVNRSFSESGTDAAYGLGAKFMLWSLEFRAEYERYDIDATDNVDMLSVGVSWVF